jgi:hypothetical protein
MARRNWASDSLQPVPAIDECDGLEHTMVDLEVPVDEIAKMFCSPFLILFEGYPLRIRGNNPQEHVRHKIQF